MYDLTGKRVWVAGHRGMVGSAVARRLEAENCEILFAQRDAVDLEERSDVERFLAEHRPHAVVMAAAKVGGILANDRNPVEFLQRNLTMELNVIKSAHEAGVEKLLFLGSSCIYPKFAPQPIKENALLTGDLEPTNEWYAIAKIAGIKLCQAYMKQHGARFISAMPTNLYGPHDNFDLQTSHVVPALIRKAHEAKLAGLDHVTIWGSGTPRREFLFSDDCADALVFILKNYEDYEHINVGSGEDIPILDLMKLIADVVGFEGRIETDPSKPDGTPRKLMSNEKLARLGWKPTTDLRDGISRAYQWYIENVR
ncbi:NAD-dependent epimerase/dehydratase family protein [Shinella kummerowiae]|uniref:GDP-L-fucose synthase n=1 Tax=Shinella kummerowiae TaxID=417745 RepID=A0A6N8SBZ7_9HYPH|nr:GDP-L-fucose synthase [Shinella kummerowiae]MXN44200.1 NAD-dependent epimerase/dehydratase family protein [Shinella kummerowiae]